MKRFVTKVFLGCSVFAIFAGAMLCRPVFAATIELKFPDVASEYAFDPQSGNIAAVDPANNKISLYGPNFTAGSPKPIASLVVGNRPASVVFKQAGTTRLFAVACLAESNIYLFDAATLKQTAKIPVQGSDVSSLAASTAPDDPYVYYCYGRGHDSACGRVQVLKQVDEGLAFDDAMDCAISAGGNYAYRRGPWSPSGFESLRKVEPATAGGKTTFQRVFYDHNSTAQYVVDPFELYTAAGSNLYTVRLDKSIAKLSFAPRCFFADHPWIVGFEGSFVDSRNNGRPGTQATGKLVVASTNTFQNIGELPLPESFTKDAERKNLAGPGQADFKFVGNRLGVFADSARNRIVLLRDDRALIVPTADLKLPDEPFLFIEVDSKTPLIVNRKNVIRPATKDARIKVELLDKPEGLALTSAGLEWTPNESQIGTQAVRLRLSHGTLERIHTVELEVVRSFLSLPVSVTRINLSDDGKTLVGWTTPNRDHNFGRPAEPGENVPRCVVVDLIGEKVLVSAALPFAAGLVAVDEHFVYAVQNGTAVVTALGRDDLGHRKQISLEGIATWIRPVGNNELVVGMNDGRWLKYSTPDLKLLAENRLGMTAGQDFGHSRNASAADAGMKRIAEGWLMPEGNVFDEGLTKPLFLKAVGTLRKVGPVVNGMNAGMNRNEQVLAPGMSLRRGGEGGEQSVVAVARIGSSPATLALTRSLQQTDVPGAIHTWKTAEVWSLTTFPSDRVDLAAARSTLVSKSAHYDQTAGGGQQQMPGALALDKEHVYCVAGSRIYRLPIAGLVGEPAVVEAPPAFKKTQSALVVDLVGTTRLKHEIVGGKAPFQFALSAPFAGLQIDPRDGTVTLDGPATTAALVDLASGTNPNMAFSGQRGNGLLGGLSVDHYVHATAIAFEQSTGSKAKGFPLAFSISVQVTDSTPRTATTSYSVLIDLPRADVEARIAKAAAEAAKQREAFAAQQQQQAMQGGGGQASAEVQARIRRLEERILTLEGQINILTKLLGDPAR